MIKLQTDFDLSTIIEKRAYVRGANILGGRCPGGASVLGANIWDGDHVTATHLYDIRQIYSKV